MSSPRPAEAVRSAAPRRRLHRGRAAVALALALFSAVLVGGAALAAPQVSILDEWTHTDYAWRITQGELPAAGSLISPEVLAEFSCRGASNATPVPPCGVSGPPEAYPFRGENYNYAHPPLYYLVTGVVAGAADAVVAGDQFFALARLTGVLWLWGGMLLLYLAVRRLGAAPGYGFLAAGVLPLSPGVLTATSVVTNDAPAVLSGSLALYLLAGALTAERIGWAAPTVAALCITATKVMNAVPFIVLVGVLVALGVRHHSRGDRRVARSCYVTAAAITTAMLVVYLGWWRFQAGRGAEDWVSPVLGVHGVDIVGLPFDEWLPSMLSGLSLQHPYTLTPQVDMVAVGIWAQALNVVLFIGVPIAIATSRRMSPQWILGIATLGGLLLYPLLVQLQAFINDQQYFPALATRYGMSLLPWAAACLAVGATHLGAWRLLLGGCGVGALVMAAAVAQAG